eukprot:CAMPEP_0118944592 /NCGR_PEP_ID=MMETSP1169-20130426/40603_1 /TAXON_ID=36882 /ORGANISM="Pyramimonas obovata, Strain CCMP722" /LENGTH=922 /DNA_ID=CAMNT_0006890103 /DNA_START=126 /DNA_END=2891 /DNA_ORIENTATION=-
MSEEINPDAFIVRRGHRRSAYFSARSAPRPETTKTKASSTMMGNSGESGSPQESSAVERQFEFSSDAQLGTREKDLMKRMRYRLSQHGASPDDLPDVSNTTVNSMKQRGEMNLNTLMQLKAAFEHADIDNSGALDQEEFVSAFKSVRSLASQPEEQLVHLFMKIDANSNGTLDWDEFTSHILLEQERLSATEEGTAAGQEGEIYIAEQPAEHAKSAKAKEKKTGLLNRRANTAGIAHLDMIERVVHVPALSSYVSAGRDGTLVVWQADTLVPKKQMRNGTGWITDMTYMPNQPLAVCSVDRTISFYDTGRTSRHPYGFEPLARINNLENVPMSAKWVRLTDYDMLLFGDDRGNIQSYKFDDLWGGTNVPAGTGIEMGNKKLPGMKANTPFKLHSDWVTKLLFQSNSGTLITSSMDSTLRMVDLERKKTKWTVDDHVRGVFSFDYSRGYNFIASCGVERHIMLWNPFTGRSVGALYGHTASVQEVLVAENENQLISLATDKAIKIWDLRSNRCLQTLLDQTVYWPENRISAIALDTKRRVIVTGSTKPKQWHRSVKDAIGVSPIIKASYNKAFRQVVAGDLSGNINVWSVDRGESVFNYSEAHGDAKLCAMSFDNSLRRLITCARNGTVNMWNFNNGKCLKVFEGFGDAEISSVAYVAEGPNRFVIAGGDDRKVVVWVDNKLNSREAVYSHLDGHYDDVTSVAFCSQSILATGAYDGKIILWKISSDSSPKGELVPPDDHLKKSDQKSIEALLFLPHRAKCLAALANDGSVYIWRIVDSQHMYTLKTGHSGRGSAICSDEENNYLITADALGYIFAWDLTDCDWRRSDAVTDMRVRREPSELAVGRKIGRKDGKIQFMHGWQAHRKEIKSVEHAKYKDGGDFVVSGSEDGKVRFWTLGGQLVGTFGADIWVLGVPESYVSDRA